MTVNTNCNFSQTLYELYAKFRFYLFLFFVLYIKHEAHEHSFVIKALSVSLKPDTIFKYICVCNTEHLYSAAA